MIFIDTIMFHQNQNLKKIKLQDDDNFMMKIVAQQQEQEHQQIIKLQLKEKTYNNHQLNAIVLEVESITNGDSYYHSEEEVVEANS